MDKGLAIDEHINADLDKIIDMTWTRLASSNINNAPIYTKHTGSFYRLYEKVFNGIYTAYNKLKNI